MDIENIIKIASKKDTFGYYGKVCKIAGLTVESIGPISQIGEICKIYSLDGKTEIMAEVIGFKENHVVLMPYSDLAGVGLDSLVVATKAPLQVKVSDSLKGRVLDGIGNPIDGKGDIGDGV